MHRWSPLNERQKALLGRLAGGEELDTQGASEWRSLYALRDRGLATVKRGSGGVQVQVTEAGASTLSTVTTRMTLSMPMATAEVHPALENRRLPGHGAPGRELQVISAVPCRTARGPSLGHGVRRRGS